MKITNCWKSVILISAVMFTSSAWAVTPAEETEKECKKPKFRIFYQFPRPSIAGIGNLLSR